MPTKKTSFAGNSNGLEDYDIEIPSNVNFSPDIEALNNLIKTAGAIFIHQSAMPCPVGLATINDSRRSHPDHSQCSNGMIYKNSGTVSLWFNNNSRKDLIEVLGIIDDSQAIVTIPTFYEDQPEKPCYVVPYDRFILADETIKVPNFERITHGQTGTDRLQFPATDMLSDIIDSDGKVYYINKDFILNQYGEIQWIPGGNSPGRNLELDVGKVISLRYLYRPAFYVARMLKETRFAKIDSFIGNNVHNQRLPSQALIQREYVFKNIDNDPEAISPNSPRQNISTPNGSFGPK
jgi:hypothetical protein